MTSPFRRHALAACLVVAAAAPEAPRASLTIAIDTSQIAAVSSPALVSQAWESWGALFQFAHLHSDPRLIAIASHLAPGVLRIGGITADWVRYPADGNSFGGSGGGTGGVWPATPMNLSAAGLASMAAFTSAANLSLLLDLNELYGRNCSLVRPDCPYTPPAPPPAWCTEWCGTPPTHPDWDTSNLRALLAGLHANGTGGPGAPPFAYELGNELLGHLGLQSNAADVARGHALLAEVWGDAAHRPALAAPATWSCQDADGSGALMSNFSAAGSAEAFSFHMYPAGQQPSFASYAARVTDAAWLRGGLLEDPATNASACLADWGAGPRAAGLDLWVTEANSGSGGAAQAPGPASFAGAFYTLAQYGLFARAGVPLVARFGLCCDAPGTGGLSTVTYDAATDAFAVVPDFWVMLLRKRTAGDAALAVSGDAAPGSPAAVFASCAVVDGAAADLSQFAPPRVVGSDVLRPRLTGGNGSVAVTAVNTAANGTLLLALTDAAGAPLATTPRLEWVLTAPSLAADAPVLNGNAGAPLRVGPDGALPPLPGRFVGAGGPSEIALPPLSQAFIVLLGAGAPACR